MIAIENPNAFDQRAASHLTIIYYNTEIIAKITYSKYIIFSVKLYCFCIMF